jgi:hypothetical protein
MDDRFLHDHFRGPRPEFARELRRRLAESGPADARRPAFRFGPALAGVAAVAVVAALFAFPSVRAQAQALLDLFRVRQFVAVEFDPGRLERFRALKDQNDAMLVFDRREVFEDPGPPREAPTLSEAEAVAGFHLETPAYLPDGLALASVHTQGRGHLRMAVSAQKLRDLLDALDLRDVQVPTDLDGRWIEVRTSPGASQRFTSGARHVELHQAPSPEVTLPPGADLARLGEVGLRILGLDRDEAARLSRTIDWTSTLVVPVPVNAGAFREVTVRGQRGLLVTIVKAAPPGPGADTVREGTLILWTEGERVFALSGNVAARDLMQMAESLR